MRLRMYGATDVGLVRKSNQDNFFCSQDYGIVIVSDGMGGHKGGEIASSLVVEGLRDAFLQSDSILIDHVGAFLDDVLNRINNEILNRSQADERLAGMGATVNYLQFAGDKVAIGHAGDSRTYLIRAFPGNDGKLYHGIWCQTIDHNVGNFIDRGLLVVGEDVPADVSEKQKSRLMRGMGVVRDLRADLYIKELKDGDVFITASDGLHGFVTDYAILNTMRAGPIANAHQRLIDLAKQAGAPDNVTVVVSVVSSVEEPLLRPPSVNWGGFPMMLRKPPEYILYGPMHPQELVRTIIQNDVPLDAEVAGPNGEWVFLSRREELLRKYRPIFDREEIMRHLEMRAPQSLIAHSTTRQSNPWTTRIVILGFLALLFLVALWFVWNHKMGAG